MSSDSEATSEQLLSVHEGAGYNEIYPLGCGPKKVLTWSLEGKMSSHSPDDGDEEDYEADGGEDDKKEDGEEREDEEEEKSDEGSHEESDGRGNRPFILPKIWTMNDFYSTMS